MNKILLFCLTLLLTISPLFPENEKTLIVSGSSRVEIPAELVELKLRVDTEANTASEAHEKTAKKTASLVKFLKTQNLLSLQTESVELHPIYEYPKTGARQIRAYNAGNSVLVRAKIDQAGKLLDESIATGANQIAGIRFLASDSNSEKATHEALQSAAKDAKKKAEQVLSALGLKFKDIIEIQADSNAAPEIPVGYMDTARAKQSTPIEGGTIFREARVTLKISY
ncbi:DUF541 domain-containing protein [Leptospira wolffii]|uniref:SIMPL domain-containing protein n=1 Tax=Leptospira wolffii TaxID=409998 RepID=UPI00108357D4|nr:SIMPL domain-containing protein [Leptospira wolffii]TGL52001.1 DUF541 domain-containing protein [Leptospira wolffii]